MLRPGTPSIEQIRTVLAVVEEGSFAAAGRRLRRATSVISYAIANIEAQLGVTLFAREGTRRPRLTAEGAAVVEELRRIETALAGTRHWAQMRAVVSLAETYLAQIADEAEMRGQEPRIRDEACGARRWFKEFRRELKALATEPEPEESEE